MSEPALPRVYHQTAVAKTTAAAAALELACRQTAAAKQTVAMELACRQTATAKQTVAVALEQACRQTAAAKQRRSPVEAKQMTALAGCWQARTS